MVKKCLIGLLIILLIIVLIGAYAISDNEARPALGEGKFVTSGDAEIHYFVSGSHTADPVVLLPSYARSVSDFNELVVALVNAGYRTIAMQPRGVDGSTLPSLQTTFHTYAADLAAVLDAEGIRSSVSIIAHAYGNRVARTFATDYPERSHQLILLAAGGEEPTPSDVSSAIVKVMFGLVTPVQREETTAYAFFAKGSQIPEYWLKGWYPLAGLAQGSATAAADTEKTKPEWFSGGNDQLFIIQPAEDAAAKNGGSSLLERFPERVTLTRLEAAGHAIFPEQPVAVTQLILTALAQQSPID